MTAIDTNVIVRFLIKDDPPVALRAAALLGHGRITVLKTVLLETEWVLRAGYGFSGVDISAGFRRLLGIPGVSAEDSSTVARALDWYEQGLDFADALHLASGAGVERFATFDRSLIRKAAKLPAAPSVFEP